jgi:uracil-DNA glycosylase
MDAKRLSYLKAMDVDVWARRDLPAPSPAVIAPSSSVLAQPSPQPIVHHSAVANTPAANDDIAAMSWDDLANTVRGCTLCDLATTRTQTVFGVGNKQAEWMVIGEAPGADEDRQGEPFVGRAGQLLNSMLQAMGFPREQVFIANVLKCRPPGNRDPKPEEAACCAPYLARQIALVNPRVILCVGRIAAQNLLSTSDAIGKLRGRVHYLGMQQRPVVVTYHPAYLLRSPGEKRKAWDDLQLALRTYAATPPRSA